MVEEFMQLARGVLDVLARALAQSDLQPRACFPQADQFLLGKNVAAVADQLARCPQDKFGLLAVSRSEKKHVWQVSAPCGEKAMPLNNLWLGDCIFGFLGR